MIRGSNIKPPASLKTLSSPRSYSFALPGIHGKPKTSANSKAAAGKVYFVDCKPNQQKPPQSFASLASWRFKFFKPENKAIGRPHVLPQNSLDNEGKVVLYLM
jgi:hypothetical protein